MADAERAYGALTELRGDPDYAGANAEIRAIVLRELCSFSVALGRVDEYLVHTEEFEALVGRSFESMPVRGLKLIDQEPSPASTPPAAAAPAAPEAPPVDSAEDSALSMDEALFAEEIRRLLADGVLGGDDMQTLRDLGTLLGIPRERAAVLEYRVRDEMGAPAIDPAKEAEFRKLLAVLCRHGAPSEAQRRLLLGKGESMGLPSAFLTRIIDEAGSEPAAS